MPVPINSLSSIGEADYYFSGKLYTQEWDNATDDTKQKYLNEATLIIDKFDYTGRVTDSTQEHKWPRKFIVGQDQTIIPKDVLVAQYEIAIALARGFNPDKESRSVNVLSRAYGSVRTTYSNGSPPDFILAGVPSAFAWGLLGKYLPAKTLRLSRKS